MSSFLVSININPKMKQLLIVFIGLTCLYSCSEDQDYTINYVVSPSDHNSENSLKVKITFHPNASGETKLLFQDKAWGQDSLHNVITTIKLGSEKGEITANRDSGWYSIKHPKNLKSLDVEYTLQQDSEGDLTTWDTYRPVIRERYFHVFSHNFFMLPKHILDTSENNFNVTILWDNFPKDYSIGNSFGSQQKFQDIKNTSEEEFHTAIFTGGDMRQYQIPINGNVVSFMTRGEWQTFKDSTMVNIIEKTVTTQRDFWKDHTQPYYAITLIPTVLERGSAFQGSGLTNSFAANASNNEFLDVEGLVYLFNHELQHNWIGSLIRNENEEKQYWFSEGFTEYYTLKNIAKTKIYNLDESYFVEKFNDIVKALFNSPVKEMPNSALDYESFWSGAEGIQKLPYYRGAMFAFYLDNKIKKDTNGEKSLDDLMLNFKDDALKNSQKINHGYFIKTANNYLKEDLTPFFNTHIEEGKLFYLEELYKDFGFEYDSKTTVYDLGFTFSEDRKRVSTINEDSEAYKAGLRQDDAFKSISYYSNSTEHKAEFDVLRNGKLISVGYYPIKEMDLPQLKNNRYNKTHLEF